MRTPQLARRRAVQYVSGLALTGAWSWLARPARAEPHLSASNPSAAALGYTEDSTRVDTRKFPQHDAAQRCANCKFFQGAAGADYAPCALYPGNAVNASGWCAGYVPK